MKGGKTLAVLLGTVLYGSLPGSRPLHAREPLSLTLESSVEIAMANSYNIRQIQLGIERTRYNLKARQAGLKSKVYMNLRVPNFNYISDYTWNSALQRDEIIKENSGLWQMDLSIRQPVILLGYPTNGYLSLNNKTYRYLQKTEGGDKNINFYNRYFVRFEQPFFRPNTLKNDIEENEIYSRQIANLEQATELAREFAEKDSTRAIETIQVQVDLANAKERLLSNQSSLRLGLARLKQRLRLVPGDSLFIRPDVQVIPVSVDLKRAVEYACTLRPRLQLLNITRRRMRGTA